tara:strand:+ start:344 stop:673 length:330 start_codon:yes stop_codon:yes gene_type:complete
MKNKILTVCVILVISILTSCKTLTEGLSGKKKDGSDVFLVKKKNPLIVPKEYNELPKPISDQDDNELNNIDDDVKQMFSDLFDTSDNENFSMTSDSSLEESVLKKIKAK